MSTPAKNRIICGVTNRQLSNVVNKIMAKEQAARDSQALRPPNRSSTATMPMPQHSSDDEVDPLSIRSVERMGAVAISPTINKKVKITGNVLTQNTETRILKVSEQTPAGASKILTMSKEEVRQIVHETIENHPKIQALDKKLTRLLYILEHKNSYQENKMSYFPIQDPTMMERLEDILEKKPDERIKIMDLFRQWSGTNTTCPALNNVFKKVFHDDYLINCNLSGTRQHKGLMNNDVLAILSDIWQENGATQEEFFRKARLCIRYAHNRVYVRRQRSSKRAGQTKDNADMKMENNGFDCEDEEEYFESDEMDE